MTAGRRRFPRSLAALAVGLLVVPLLAAPIEAADDDSTLTELAILETVEAHIASDGTPQTARLHTRLDAQGSGVVELLDPTAVTGLRERGRLRTPDVEAGNVRWELDLTDGVATRQTVADYPTRDLPISARMRYQLDGEAVSADELRGASGEAVISMQLRNPTSEPRGVVVGTGEDRRLETVDVALPLLAETHVSLDDSWGEVTADAGRVGVGAEGVSVAWSAALFEPLGSTVTELEIRGRVEGAKLPTIEVEATPVTAASSDLIAAAKSLLEDRATVDAVAAFLASSLAEALGGVGEGAAQLADGLGELEAGLADTADFDPIDPEALAGDALAGLADGLDPTAFEDLFEDAFADFADPDLPDPEALLADFDPADLLAELDFDAVLDQFDPAALLADADFGALLEAVLAEAFPELPELDFDPDLIEGVLADAFAAIGDDLALEDLLAEIDLGALLEDLDLDDAIRAALDDIDLADLFADFADELDLEALLAGIDLDALLTDLLGAIELGDLGDLIDDLVGDATVGDLLGDVDVAELVALLAADGQLEIELAAAVAALLGELDIELPTVGQAELKAVGGALQAALHVVEGLVLTADHALDLLEKATGDDAVEAIDGVAELGEGLAGRLATIGDALDGLGHRLLDPVDEALAHANAKLSEADAALAELESDVDDELVERVAAIRSSVDAAAGAVGTAQAGLDEARAHLDALSGEFDGLAEGVAGLAEALRAAEPSELDPDGRLEAVADAIRELRDGLVTVEGKLAHLLATVDELRDDLDDDVSLEELLLAALEGRSVDIEPILVDAGERVLAQLEDVRIDELLDAVGLAELLDELDLDAALEDLLADLDLPDLAELLDEAGIDLATLLGELDIDLADLLADVDLSPLLAAFEDLDIDLAALLDDLDIDPAALLADVDLAGLFDEIDLTAVLGAALEDFDFADIEELLADVDLDLAELLAEAGIDPEALFADIELPDFADVMPDLDFDALLADLRLDPAAMLADVELPGFEALLADLDVDFDALLAQAGLDELGDLDDMIGGLIEALAGLAEGGDELAAGLAQLTDEGLGQLIAQLDDDARAMERDLATLRLLERRAGDAQPTASPAGADTAASYRLVFEPEQPLAPGAAALGALLAGALGAEGLRRRWSG